MIYSTIVQAEGINFPLAVSQHKRIKIRVANDLFEVVKDIGYEEQEIVVVILLDGHNQVLSHHIVTIGIANQSQMHPRECFKHAVRWNAVSIALVHNHPSGNLEPSESDLVATRRMVEVGKLLGIHVLDHLIIGGSSFRSIREQSPMYFV